MHDQVTVRGGPPGEEEHVERVARPPQRDAAPHDEAHAAVGYAHPRVEEVLGEVRGLPHVGCRWVEVGLRFVFVCVRVCPSWAVSPWGTEAGAQGASRRVLFVLGVSQPQSV